MRSIFLIIYLVSFLLITACSTAGDIKRMEIENEKRKIAALRSFIEQSSPQAPASEFEIFVSYEALNEIFSHVLPTEFPATEHGYLLTLHTATFNGTYGASNIELEISALDPKRGFSVNVATSAAVVFEVVDTENPTLRGKVLIERMVPVANWGPWRYRFGSFINDLIKLEAQKISDSLPPILIPLNAQEDISFPASIPQRLELGGTAYVTGRLIPPNLDTKLKFSFSRSNAYPDGIRISGTVALEKTP